MGLIDRYYLHPSNLFVSGKDCWVDTVLGSCVSVCLIDKERQLGGINHYMIPFWNGDGLESPRYGNVAIKRLIQELIELGAQRSCLEAKLFGGGKILSDIKSFHIGERNIAIAYKILDEENIPVVASSTGGDRGRKLLFNPFTGEVLQKYLNGK